MSRYFCLIDTLDTLNNRVIINIATRNNIEQAIAENLCPKLTHEQRVAQALKPSSDYVDKIWVHQQNTVVDYVMHVESASIEFADQTFTNTSPWTELKEHEFKKSHINWISNDHVNNHNMVSFSQNRYRITNTQSRAEYYARHVINREIMSLRTKIPGFMIWCDSRKCQINMSTSHVWKQWTGAMIEKSTHNTRDRLRRIL